MNTVEEVDQALEALEGTAERQLDANATVAQARLFNICAVYSKARPVLKFVRGLLFWKPKWQKIIEDVMTNLDASCEL